MRINYGERGEGERWKRVREGEREVLDGKVGSTGEEEEEV